MSLPPVPPQSTLPPIHIPPVHIPIPLNLQEIQGNVLAGFNKDHQRFLFLQIQDAAKAKTWLKAQLPRISNCKTVKDANDQRKADLKANKTPANAHWLNIAFNFPGLQKLGGTNLTAFPAEFKNGMTASASTIGDLDGNSPAHWEPWAQNRDSMHIMLQVAADDLGDLEDQLLSIGSSLPGSGLTLVHMEVGEAPPGDDSPNEHFGFRDGISQPGIKGFTASVGSNPTQGIPGQDLLWPGEFVLGYETQIGVTDPSVDGPNPKPGTPSSNGPDWSKNGSFLVFRKLRQDVAGFRNSVRTTASNLGVNPEVLGGKFVGRFRSGCPMEKLSNPPNTLDPNDGDPSKTDAAYLTEQHINDFEYGEDLPGTFSPHSAHVRKAYPRDEKFLLPNGKEDPNSALNESTTQTHRILRRGIPFGTYMPLPAQGLAATYKDDGVSRGLLFLCYQRSIHDQFEFIQSQWVNASGFPEKNDGEDPVMAQVKSSTMTCPFKGKPAPVSFPLQHFVNTRGGEYFFQPSLSALTTLAT